MKFILFIVLNLFCNNILIGSHHNSNIRQAEFQWPNKAKKTSSWNCKKLLPYLAIAAVSFLGGVMFNQSISKPEIRFVEETVEKVVEKFKDPNTLTCEECRLYTEKCKDYKLQCLQNALANIPNTYSSGLRHYYVTLAFAEYKKEKECPSYCYQLSTLLGI